MKAPLLSTLNIRLLALRAAVMFAGGGFGAGSAFGAEATKDGPCLPRLSPDYTGITIPPNIAPLNFRVAEPGKRFRVELRSTRGEAVVVNSRSPAICFPLHAWQNLLHANAGEPLRCEVSVQDAGGRWNTFQTVTNVIAREEIDRTLVYRLLKPLYNVYVNVGLYQRNLESFDERPVIENKRFGKGCVNCHTPLNHKSDTFAFNIRGTTNAQPMILVCSNKAVRVDKTMGYLSWHPSGRLIAFSANKLSLFYHTQPRNETRDVFDASSRLGIYRVDSNTFSHPPPVALTNRNETWPSWSPDGRYLYFCSTQPVSTDDFRQVRYDLMRVAYDLERDVWGEPETLLSAAVSGASAAQPRVSPDGRLLLFTLCKYGNFPIYQTSADLFVMNLETRQVTRPEINSDRADSWHCWSTNGRWVVFSSKRMDGLFARPFFTYVDAKGRFHKPFLLPQADPAFYDSYLKTFNVPELVNGIITTSEDILAQTITHPEKPLVPQAAVQSGTPAQLPSENNTERSHH
ncbi:MAG TPA: hypothetical protein VK327_15255, partial [Candidatus Paceibacterota bacterium]|nr:hypothetical protein [Candidatus Paceibacterota bacterium]